MKTRIILLLLLATVPQVVRADITRSLMELAREVQNNPSPENFAMFMTSLEHSPELEESYWGGASAKKKLCIALSFSNVNLARRVIPSITPEQLNGPIDTPLKMGVCSNSPNLMTPLLFALLRNQVAIAELLLQGGADPNLLSRGPLFLGIIPTYCTPLSMAESQEMVDLLLRHGADQSEIGYTIGFCCVGSDLLPYQCFRDQLRRTRNMKYLHMMGRLHNDPRASTEAKGAIIEEYYKHGMRPPAR